jgi:hypothetical protein
MSNRELVEKIKSMLLKNYVIACCCRECVESLKRITNVLYIDAGIGLALVEKVQGLKELLGIDDETLRDSRVLALSIREGYCYAEMFLGDIDAEKAEEIALAALAIVKLSKLFRNPVEASTQYS